MNILTVPTVYIVSPSSNITYCKSLWIKASAKCPQSECKCKSMGYMGTSEFF